MQRRIAVRADVGRQRDGGHVDGAVGRDGGVPLLRVVGVAGEYGAACVNGGGDVPDAGLGAKVVVHAPDAMRCDGDWKQFLP